MFKLICYCSIATVACTWYIEILPYPPHCLGSLAGGILYVQSCFVHRNSCMAWSLEWATQTVLEWLYQSYDDDSIARFWRWSCTCAKSFTKQNHLKNAASRFRRAATASACVILWCCATRCLQIRLSHVFSWFLPLGAELLPFCDCIWISLAVGMLASNFRSGMFCFMPC